MGRPKKAIPNEHKIGFMVPNEFASAMKMTANLLQISESELYRSTIALYHLSVLERYTVRNMFIDLMVKQSEEQIDAGAASERYDEMLSILHRMVNPIFLKEYGQVVQAFKEKGNYFQPTLIH